MTKNKYPRSMSDFGIRGTERARGNSFSNSVRIDSLGLATVLRSEALTACSLLVIA
jgi:hypothetical protein